MCADLAWSLQKFFSYFSWKQQFAKNFSLLDFNSNKGHFIINYFDTNRAWKSSKLSAKVICQALFSIKKNKKKKKNIYIIGVIFHLPILPVKKMPSQVFQKNM